VEYLPLDKIVTLLEKHFPAIGAIGLLDKAHAIISSANPQLDQGHSRSHAGGMPSNQVAKRVQIDQISFMKKTRRRKAVWLPAMMTELMLSSFETIARRSWMLAQGKCSPTEFARMVLEKQQALSLSGIALLSGASATSILTPFHRGATANAKRLRRK